jgi:hypothetical protein
MEFSYTLTWAALTALLRGTVLSAEKELLEDLQRLADLADGGATPPVADLERTGDRLRDLGFALRRTHREDVEGADLIFTAGNALWRWAFFLDQHPSAMPPPDATAREHDRIADTVLRHLRRPWGIVTVHDVQQAFRGLAPGDEHDELPRAFSVLTPLMSSDVEPFLAAEAGIKDPAQARRLVRRLIACRHLLHATRLRLRTVILDQTEDRTTAALLIRLFERWAYESDDRLAQIDGDPDILVSLLRSSTWCDDLPYEKELSIEMTDAVRRYRADPARLVERLFRFSEPDFVMVDNLGFMPPEQFTFGVTSATPA